MLRRLLTALLAAVAAAGLWALLTYLPPGIGGWGVDELLTYPAIGHRRPVMAVAFSGSGTLVASVDRGGEAIVWRTADGVPQRRHRLAAGALGRLATGGALAARAGGRLSVGMPPEGTGDPTGTATAPLTATTVGRRAEVAATGSATPEVIVWQLTMGTGGDLAIAPLQLAWDGEALLALAFAGDHLLAIDGAGTLVRWRLPVTVEAGPAASAGTGAAAPEPETYGRVDPGLPSAAAFSPDGRLVALGGADGTLRLGEVRRTLTLVSPIVPETSADPPWVLGAVALSLAVAPDGGELAVGRGAGTARSGAVFRLPIPYGRLRRANRAPASNDGDTAPPAPSPLGPTPLAITPLPRAPACLAYNPNPEYAQLPFLTSWDSARRAVFWSLSDRAGADRAGADRAGADRSGTARSETPATGEVPALPKWSVVLARVAPGLPDRCPPPPSVAQPGQRFGLLVIDPLAGKETYLEDRRTGLLLPLTRSYYRAVALPRRGPADRFLGRFPYAALALEGDLVYGVARPRYPLAAVLLAAVAGALLLGWLVRKALGRARS